MSEWKFKVHCPTLRKNLCGKYKLPGKLREIFYNTTLPSDELQRLPNGECIRSSIKGDWTVIVKSTAEVRKNKHKSSAHRIFIHCQCGRIIPAGRLHQHKGACHVD
jgi:hypothetical protein